MLRLPFFLSGVLLILLCGSPSAESLPQTTNSRANPSQQDTSPVVPNSDTTAAPDPKTSIHFRDVSPQVGITTVPHTRLDRHYVLDTMAGGGVALFDCDNDGKLDIAVINDSTIEKYLQGGDLMVTLYHQDSNSPTLHFTDITQSAGLTTKGYGMGIAVGDYDNDGLPDLYITGYGHNVLYHNLGNCKFEDVTKKAGLEVSGFSTGAAWADYDRDGFLDLFVARYVETDPRHPPDPAKSRGYKGVLVELPDTLKGETDFLFRNRGDGTFEDVSVKTGVNDAHLQHGMGVVWGDYDNDGWPDLYVTNDTGWNYLYHNNQDGTFEDVGIPSGTGLGPFGQFNGNMAAAFGDLDRDGKLDLVVTRFGGQPASLYWNRGDFFTDIAAPAKIARPTFAPVKWGTGFGDFDNSGWPDIIIANGNFTSLMDTISGEARFAEPLQLFRNLGDRTFEEIADSAGLNDGPLFSRRGTAFGDINNDGNLDMVVFNVGAPPSVFLNRTANGNHRVLFRLIGTKSNMMAIGARVRVTTPKMSQIDEVHGGGSYNSSDDTRLHFGLGNDAVMDKVEISWPSGLKQEFTNVAADAIYEIKEGQAMRKVSTLPAP